MIRSLIVIDPETWEHEQTKNLRGKETEGGKGEEVNQSINHGL